MNDRARIEAPPEGRQRLRWLGPGLLWMVSAAGSGELLFTPRVGALYGYVLLWALTATVTLKWFINRELGRWAVCTGSSALDGFAQLGGPRNWAVWLILLPQAVVAVTGTAGLAGAAANAFSVVLPGGMKLWMLVAIGLSGALVFWGRYAPLEWIARIWGSLLAVAAFAAAAKVFPPPGELLAGFVPRMPEEVDYAEVLPWIGFTLAGAAGLLWYSYWVPAKGYGAAGVPKEGRATEEARGRLEGWSKQMTLDNTVAVLGAFLVTVAFLILGTQLLKPNGLVPEEEQMARTLGEMLGGVFGRVGFWLMIGGLAVGFWSTTLSNQDGHGRMFANGTRLILPARLRERRWTTEPKLRRVFVVVLLTALPAALYLWKGQPVGLLKLAGAIEADAPAGRRDADPRAQPAEAPEPTPPHALRRGGHRRGSALLHGVRGPLPRHAAEGLNEVADPLRPDASATRRPAPAAAAAPPPRPQPIADRRDRERGRGAQRVRRKTPRKRVDVPGRDMRGTALGAVPRMFRNLEGH